MKDTTMEIHADRRHEITDRTWALLEPHLPRRSGSWGGMAEDDRTFINAVVWVMRSGKKWHALPRRYGDWTNMHRRLVQWRDKEFWQKVVEILNGAPRSEWLTINAGGRLQRPRIRRKVWRRGHELLARKDGARLISYQPGLRSTLASPECRARSVPDGK